jgi:hypothetical protein
MKKLAVVLMIPALVMLMAPLAVAGQAGWGAIHGTYAMIATGSCLYSTLGFYGDHTPVAESAVWGATTMAQAVWTFDSRGTGAVTHGWNYVLDLPPGAPGVGPIARQHDFSFTFHYEVDHDGVITIYPPSGPNILGVFSTDHKIVTLGSANVPEDLTEGPAICNTARTLYWVSN